METSSWWNDFTSALSSAGSFVKDNISGDGLKGVAAVAGAIGQYQANQDSKKQFNELMGLKLEDYERQKKRQETMDANWETGFANSAYGTSSTALAKI